LRFAGRRSETDESLFAEYVVGERVLDGDQETVDTYHQCYQKDDDGPGVFLEVVEALDPAVYRQGE